MCCGILWEPACGVLVLASFMYVTVSANVAFPHGLVPSMQTNNSLKDKFYLKILKDKIQREINKYRGNSTSSTAPEVPEEPEVPVKEPPRYDPQFVSSDSPGKNLLRFTLNRNAAEFRDSEVTRVNLWIHVWQKERKKKREPRRRKKGKLIRIVVHNTSSKGDDVIAELRTRIQATNWFRISLPISLVRDLETSHNDTLVLRVDCKRCNRRTKLLLPQKGKLKCKKGKKKRKRKKKKRKKNKLNRRGMDSLSFTKRGCGTVRNNAVHTSKQRRPFMVIEQRYKSFDRQKRSLTCNPADIIRRNGTVTSTRCCRVSSYVEFSDLELDDYIVTPGGYEASRCIGRCPRKHRGRHRSARRRRGRNRNRNRGERDRKSKRGRCRAVQTSPLTVWLFDSNHDLVQAQLPDLVVRNCDCR